MILWPLLLLCLLLYEQSLDREEMLELARAVAITVVDKDIVYRKWNEMHGGVYAQVSDKTSPNPNLSHVPERDIITPSGRKLTLINPAYMTRQIYEMEDQGYGYRCRITSLKPLRKKNAPDPWEAEALRAFANGITDYSSKEVIDGEEYLRYMRPFVTETSCLECHASQGYKEGDIRGGISVAVPLKPFWDANKAELRDRYVSYGTILLIGLIIMGAGSRQLSSRSKKIVDTTEALRKSEDTLKNAQSIAHIGSWELDMISGKLTWSDEVFRIFEIDPAEFDASYEAFLNTIHPDDRETVNAAYKNSLVTHMPYEIEHRIQLQDGRIKHIFEKCETFYDAEGKPLRSIGTVQDITERKKTEVMLRKLSRSVEQSPVSIIITDTKGTIEYVNPKFSELTGYTFDEAIGKNPRIFQSEQTPPEVYHQLWTTISAGKNWHGEFCNKKKNGDLYWESATIAPVADESGTVTHYVAIKMDITEIKETHDALNKANMLLEFQATTDSLTGISNRLKFDEILIKELGRSKRYGIPLSIVMFDIDHFKNINDSFGHHIGDTVLKELTANIALNIRKHDYFSRWGGEEFMILLTHTTIEPAMHFAENCRVQIEDLKIGGLENITCSFGVTELREDDSIFSFTKRVDAALYNAKSWGRNRVEKL